MIPGRCIRTAVPLEFLTKQQRMRPELFTLPHATQGCAFAVYVDRAGNTACPAEYTMNLVIHCALVYPEPDRLYLTD